MKKFIPILLSFSALFSSCIAIPKKSSFSQVPFDKTKTIRVVGVLNEDLMIGKIEHHLSKAGFLVMPENVLRTNLQTGEILLGTSDTTLSIPQNRTFGVKMFEEKQVDYIMKVVYVPSLGNRAFFNLSAVTIDAKTGRTVSSFDFRQMPFSFFKQKAERTLKSLTESLK